jgi:hypothetical protein
MPDKLCACGKPLHYTSPEARALVELMIGQLGETIIVTIGEKSFKVPRHFIALHGLAPGDFERFGFEEVEVRYA